MEQTASADALATALRRIETALARLEGAAESLSEQHAGLARRHRALKQNVTEALGEIDVLIAANRPQADDSRGQDAR